MYGLNERCIDILGYYQDDFTWAAANEDRDLNECDSCPHPTKITKVLVLKPSLDPYDTVITIDNVAYSGWRCHDVHECLHECLEVDDITSESGKYLGHDSSLRCSTGWKGSRDRADPKKEEVSH
jgi:hypothetical protein